MRPTSSTLGPIMVIQLRHCGRGNCCQFCKARWVQSQFPPASMDSRATPKRSEKDQREAPKFSLRAGVTACSGEGLLAKPPVLSVLQRKEGGKASFLLPAMYSRATPKRSEKDQREAPKFSLRAGITACSGLQRGGAARKTTCQIHSKMSGITKR